MTQEPEFTPGYGPLADSYNPADSAPKDGSMLRLLVDYSTGHGSLDDAMISWTIGFNSLLHTGEDWWEIAGWNWEQDCFCNAQGEILGWLPFDNPSVPESMKAVEEDSLMMEAHLIAKVLG